MSLITWTQVVLIALFALFAYIILKKKAYFLISGFATRPDDEQEALIENGYPQGVGKLFLLLAAGMAALQLTVFFGFSYTFEIQIAFLFIVLFGGSILLSGKEIPKKRKRAFITSSVVAMLVIGGIGILLAVGSSQPELTFTGKAVEISGMYGETIGYKDIRTADLLDELPDIAYKENGFAFSSFARGWFKTRDYGSALLFVDDRQKPVLFLDTTDGPVFITGDTPSETKEWKKQIDEKTDAPAG